MGLLNRSALLQKEPLKMEKVDLGNDEFVYVKEMTGKQRDMFEQSLRKQVVKGKTVDYEMALDNFRAKLAVATVCDETGVLLLTPRDVDALGENMGAARLAMIADAAGKLNKISEEEQEDLVKNSNAGEKDNSTSGSAGSSE